MSAISEPLQDTGDGHRRQICGGPSFKAGRDAPVPLEPVDGALDDRAVPILVAVIGLGTRLVVLTGNHCDDLASRQLVPKFNRNEGFVGRHGVLPAPASDVVASVLSWRCSVVSWATIGLPWRSVVR